MVAFNTRDDSTHGQHQTVNTKIRLIIFLATKDGETLYSQQKKKKKKDLELTVALTMNSYFQIQTKTKESKESH